MENKKEVVLQQVELNDIIKKKILLHRMALKNLDYQEQYARAVIRFQARMVEVAKAKKILVQQLNPLYESQLSNYTPAVEVQCHKLCASINALDLTPAELKKYTGDINEYEGPMVQLMNTMEQLERTIPEIATYKQWKIKDKKPEPAAENTTCAQDAMAFGLD
jgi:hypothetical protein